MPDYLPGHIKRNPDTGEVAIRTMFDESLTELEHLAWLGATIGAGPRHHRTSDVDHWDDLHFPPFVAPEGTPAPPPEDTP
jgi:hypothetical protein